MKVDLGQVGAAIFPVLKTVGIGIIIIGGSAAFGWYWFIIRRRKKWLVNVWERKADGRLHLINKDTLTAKKFNKGKSIMYVLRYARAECMPPPWEATYRLRGKEYCDYLRVEDDYIPIERGVEQEFGSKKEKSLFIKAIRTIQNKIHTLTPDDLEQRYIYIPINNSLATKIRYEPLDYDVNMMRINAIDNLDTIFKDKENFMQKYGTIIAYTMVAGLLIIALYLSYDFAQNVISQALGAADKVADPLSRLVDKLGGNVPPS